MKTCIKHAYVKTRFHLGLQHKVYMLEMTQDVSLRWEIQVTGIPGDSANMKHPLWHPPTTIYTWRHEWLKQVRAQL